MIEAAKPPCLIDGCTDDTRRVLGYCYKHYKRFSRHGDPLGGRKRDLIRGKTDEETFWLNVDAFGDCWEWTGGRNEGRYGRFSLNDDPMPDRNVYAHRYCYELLVGQISEDMTLDHLCKNIICVNPDHLEVVTRSENMSRGPALVAKNKKFCKHGHKRTPENTYIVPKTGLGECIPCKVIRMAKYAKDHPGRQQGRKR